MNPEIEKFIKEFSEKRNEFQDPKLSMDNGILTLTNKGFDKLNLIGNTFLIVIVPIIIAIILTKMQFPNSTTLFLFGFATVWFIITLYKRIQKIKANNNVKIDLNQKSITIAPQDYLRKNMLNQDERSFSFNSIRGVRTKQRNYDKFNSGFRLVISYKHENLTLVDIWTKQLGAELTHFIQNIITEK